MQGIIIQIKNLRSMSLNLIIRKVIKKVISKFYYKLRKISLKRNPIDLDKNYFQGFETKCQFFFDCNNKSYYIENILNVNVKNNIASDADKILCHIFNLLGSGEIYLGYKLPWNKDYKSGYVWKNDFYKNIKIVDLSANSDVKVPWELSRFQHVFALGKAYWLTGDDKYALEFKDEIEDFIDKNPVEMSVNWTCTMEVAIRAVNLLAGYFFFKDCSAINKDFWCNFNKILYLYGRYIFNNLENKGEITGNHYLSDIVGLIWLGIYFGEFVIYDKEELNNPKTWLSFGIKELEKEMLVQVNEDGTDYEASTAYHRLVTELFLLTTIICYKNSIMFSEKYILRLEKMCEFIMNITKPNGLTPLVGDNDDGRLLIVSSYLNWDRRDFRHILAVAGEFFNRDDFRYYGSKFKEEALWITGAFKENINTVVELKSKAYRDGGYYILRNKRIYCLIRCGQLSGRGQGGHSHNDQLSFELNVDGEDFIVDPGTYVYTADYKMRNLFRSTACHNTLYVHGYEQNDFDKYNLFEMREQSFGECREFSSDLFVGRHFGYEEKLGLVHERAMSISESQVNIKDNILSYMNHKITANFILDNKVQVIQNKNQIKLIKNGIQIDVGFSENISCALKEWNISKGYGKIDRTNVLKLSCSGNSFDFFFNIKFY